MRTHVHFHLIFVRHIISLFSFVLVDVSAAIAIMYFLSLSLFHSNRIDSIAKFNPRHRIYACGSKVSFFVYVEHETGWCAWTKENRCLHMLPHAYAHTHTIQPAKQHTIYRANFPSSSSFNILCNVFASHFIEYSHLNDS